MATSAKKGSKDSEAKPRRRTPKKPPAKQTQTISELKRELAEARAQQAATSEILGVIASSPTDIQPVLDVVAERAARLCDANDSHIRLIDGTVLRLVASCGSISLPEEYVPINRDRPASRAIIDRQTIHIHDLQAVRDREFPDIRDVARGVRSLLAVPLLREDIPIGVIIIRRLVVQPFSEKHIELLKTFADQAVIAIENVRLFQERENRNRDVTALHDVTAAVSQSLEIKPVLDEVVKKITEIFHFDSVSVFLFDPENETLDLKAASGIYQMETLPRAFRRGHGLTGRVAETGQHMIFEDVRSDPRYRELSATKDLQQRDACFIALFPIKAKEKFLGTDRRRDPAD
jgi:GAF domain-containing protein